MNKITLQEQLIQIITPYVSDATKLKDISPETNFISDLEINSAHLVDIILDIEDAFDIRIENDEMEKMLNVGASIEIIQSKIG